MKTQKSTRATMDDVLGYQLVQASIATNKAFHSEVGKPFDLRPVEFTLLQLVRETPDISPTRLAKILSVTTPGITAWIDKLSSRALLIRSKSKADGRAQHLKLTTKGSRLVDEALQKLLVSDAQLMSHLTAGEQLMLLELLGKFSGARQSKL
ncbi:MAG: MarR family winged helix-turn-helix transcriptional regulator [Cytophagales bacterium]|nr:MarR family winged helix-turn-helix transcriptional regulator [Cytophagales bacterium]